MNGFTTLRTAIDMSDASRQRKAKNPLISGLNVLRLAEKMWRSIVVISIPKSGTNLTKLLLANYLNLYYGGRTDVTTYDEMHEEMFYADAQVKKLDKSSKPGKGQILQRHTPYRHLVHTHGHGPMMAGYIRANRNGRFILLHRNPLDNMVSSFFYHYKLRPETAQVYSHPREIIDIKLPLFIRCYNYQKKVAASNDNVMRVSYEDLYRCKGRTFAGILDFLDIPVEQEKVDQAVDFSSIKAVRTQEKRRKKAIHQDIEGFRGSFVRSGKIGQWKEFFGENDVNRISDELARYQISLKEFTIE